MTKEETKAKAKATRDKPENKAKKKAIRDKPENKAKAKANRDKPENKEKNKEKIKARQKAYNEKPENKAKKKASNKAYTDKPENKEKKKATRDKPENKAKKKAKLQTPEGIKSQKISVWKSEKIISNDWNSTFDWFMNTKNCEKCDVVLESGKGKHLDHDHSITDGPNTRAVLCMPCNIHEGHKRHASKEEKDKYHNEKIKCDCGADVLRRNMNKHKKTAKHINFHKNL